MLVYYNNNSECWFPTIIIVKVFIQCKIVSEETNPSKVHAGTHIHTGTHTHECTDYRHPNLCSKEDHKGLGFTALGWTQTSRYLLGNSGGIVNSLDF